MGSWQRKPRANSNSACSRSTINTPSSSIPSHKPEPFMNILQINSSIRGAASASTGLATRLVERLRVADPNSELVIRDLGKNPHPILDEAALIARFTPPESRTSEQAARLALDDERVAEIQKADVIVVSAPMYNLGVSVQLKSWI